MLLHRHFVLDDADPGGRTGALELGAARTVLASGLGLLASRHCSFWRLRQPETPRRGAVGHGLPRFAMGIVLLLATVFRPAIQVGVRVVDPPAGPSQAQSPAVSRLDKPELPPPPS